MFGNENRTTWRRWLVTAMTVLAVAATARAGEGQSEKGGPGDGERKVEREVKVVRKLGPDGCQQMQVSGAGPGGPNQFFFLANRGFLGVELTPLTPELRRHFGVAEDAGVLVGKVVDGSAAAAAGLQVGDIVTHVDGAKVAAPGDLGRAVRQKSGGDTVALEYWRDGKTARTSATLEERERCAFDFSSLPALEGLPGKDDFDFVFDIDPAAWSEAVGNLQEVFKDQDWSKHFAELKDLDLGEVERRMEDVQKRLEELERDLEHETRKLERLDRDRERHRDRQPAAERPAGERPSGGSTAL